MRDPDELIDTSTAAEMAGTTPHVIRRAVRDKKLRAIVLGHRTRRYRVGDVTRWIEGCATTEGPSAA